MYVQFPYDFIGSLLAQAMSTKEKVPQQANMTGDDGVPSFRYGGETFISEWTISPMSTH
jgi:hypothetical protein